MKEPINIRYNRYYYSVDIIHNLTMFYQKRIIQRRKYIFFGKYIDVEIYEKCFIINVNLNHYIKDYYVDNSKIQIMIQEAEQAFCVKELKKLYKKL